MLRVTPFSLDQLDITTGQVLASYCYKDIKTIQEVTDIPDGFVVVCAADDRLVSEKSSPQLLYVIFRYEKHNSNGCLRHEEMIFINIVLLLMTIQHESDALAVKTEFTRFYYL